MSEAPTLESVARHAGVSRQTVSNALNAPDRLAPDTLARVRAAIDELGYSPHAAARSLRLRSTGMLGYCIEPAVPGRLTPVLDRFLHALTDSANEREHRVILVTAESVEHELELYEDLLRRRAVDGFVLSHTSHADPRPAWLSQRGIPFVSFGRPWDVPDSALATGDWVDVDGRSGTERAVEHLVSTGRTRIAYLGWPQGSAVGEDRRGGWLAALQRAGLQPAASEESVDDPESAQQAARRLLDAHPDERPDALVCASDTLALGAYHALAERGLVIGSDVAVVGFDDAPIAAYLSPGLTTLRQPLEAVGRSCVELLVGRITGTRASSARVLLEPDLIVRPSTAPAPSTSASRRERTPRNRKVHSR